MNEVLIAFDTALAIAVANDAFIAAAKGADDALGDGAAKFHRCASGENDVADAEFRAVADGGGFKAGSVDFDERDIGQRVGADDLRCVSLSGAVGIDIDLDFFGIGDDVVVRQNVAVGGHDHT